MHLRTHPILRHIQIEDITPKNPRSERRDFAELYDTILEALETTPPDCDPVLHVMRCIIYRHGGDRLQVPALKSFKRAERARIEERIDQGASDAVIALEVGLTKATIKAVRRLHARANTK